MPYITLETDELKVLISSFGAEMQSLFGKSGSTEYLWQGNPKFWGRRAPHLFPIIGGLKDGRFVYDSRSYEMGNHGFARDSEFAVEALSKTKAVFTLCERKENYPFDYLLSITYALKRNRLKITYTVKNTGKRKLYFSVGGHPAFACPINPALKYSDYFIEFEKDTAFSLSETAGFPFSTHSSPGTRWLSSGRIQRNSDCAAQKTGGRLR